MGKTYRRMCDCCRPRVTESRREVDHLPRRAKEYLYRRDDGRYAEPGGKGTPR